MTHRSSLFGQLIARFNFIGRLQTYRNIAYLTIWSALWAIFGLVIVSSLSFAILGLFNAPGWSIVLILFAIGLTFLLTSVERPLLIYLSGREVDPVKYPQGDARERLFGYLLDIRSLGTMLLAGVKWIIGTVVGTASIFLLFASGALIMLPSEYDDPETPEIGTELLFGAPTEMSWTVDFVYNLWELSFSYSTYIDSMGVTTFQDALLAAGVGLILLIVSIYLLNVGGQLLTKANEWALKYSRPLTIAPIYGLFR